MSPHYQFFVGLEACAKVILTSGSPNGVFAFANEDHVDSRDEVSPMLKPYWMKELDPEFAGREEYTGRVATIVDKI
jgi:hypothetical protein